MEKVEANIETLGDKGFGVFKNWNMDFNGEMGSEDGGFWEDDKGVVESGVFVEGEKGGGDRSVSCLGVDNKVMPGVENDNFVAARNNVLVLVEAIDILDGEDGGGKKCGGDDDEHKTLSGEVTGLKSLNKVEEDRDGEKKYAENGAEGAENDEDDGVGDQSHEFHVGDFVWGKIKSYPWWPGQIYDASDASHSAEKLKQKDGLLVAYFGDGSFSWCSRSRLKPFIENFKEMSEQSNSKSFLYAVGTCLDEVSRIVELDMTCSCVAEDDKREPGMVSNSGIKEGVLVPVKGVAKSFIDKCEPEDLIAKLRNFAKTVSVNNMFDLTVTKSWLTAYYRAKGGYRLPSYHYPVVIQGLEDKTSNPMEVHVHRPNGKQWFSVPVVAVGSGFNQSDQPFLQKCTDTATDILYPRRKQKSVLELVEDEIRKEEKVVNESNSIELISGKRKREDSNAVEKQDNTLIASQSGAKRGRKKKFVASGSPGIVGETSTNGKFTDFGAKEADSAPPSTEPKIRKLVGAESEDAEEVTRNKKLRERKRSEYLSSPFTNPIHKMKNSSLNIESETVSEKNSRVGERMTKAAGRLIGLQSHEFHVGDFVWGKIKSYPWWPGQIYDASDASYSAEKLKKKDRFLVAYFGDGTYSWCSGSQLKPFIENFKEMSEQSNSKSFIYALETCLDEFSRTVELDMTCSCVAEDYKREAGVASNSGIKEGVLVPVKGVARSFTEQCEPKDLITKLRNFAKTVSVNNMFDLIVSRSWLTAYYRAKGGYRLPTYLYPVLIQGLDEKTSNPIEVPVRGPNGEQWFSAPVLAVDSGFNQSNQPFLQKCLDTVNDIQYQRRKKKSVAEHIEYAIRNEESVVNESNSVELASGKREREENNEAEKQDNTLIASQSGVKSGGKKKVVASGSPRTIGITSKNGECTDSQGKEVDDAPPSTELKIRKLAGAENEDEEEAIQSKTSRKRKRSKYLSSPFTNPIHRMKISSLNIDSETESKKNSRVGERITKASGSLIGLQTTSNEITERKLPIERSSKNAQSDSLSPETALQDHSKTKVSMDLTASPSQLLSQLVSAAVDSSCVRKNRELEFVKENVSTFRDSRFKNPVNNNVQQKCQSDSTKRKFEYKPQEIGNGSIVQDLKTPPAKKATGASDNRTDNESVERNTAPVVLVLTFPPACSLPSKEELIKIYGKFGEVNEKETDMFNSFLCAQVSYLSSSDAEEAYKASVEKNPFGTANVNYWLQYPSAAKLSDSSQKLSLDNATPSVESDDEAADVGLMREKLKMMSSTLNSFDGRVSAEMKSKLEGDVKVLLEKVSLMAVAST